MPYRIGIGSGKKDLVIIDVHVHPLVSETQILEEMDKAGVDRSILLGTDTDPLDVDKPEIKEKMRKRFNSSKLYSHPYFLFFHPIEEGVKRFFYALINQYSNLKNSNLDVAELVEKYPNRFIGFGSVNLNKGEEYVEEKLREISRLNLRGIKRSPWEFICLVQRRLARDSKSIRYAYLLPILVINGQLVYTLKQLT